MLVNYNGVLRPMGYPYPLFFFMNSDRKISPEQLKKNLRIVVERYVTAAVNNNNNKTGADYKDNSALRTEVKSAVQNAINELFKEILDAKIKVSPSADASVDTSDPAPAPSKSKVFNLGSYVSDMNAELNKMINNAIPL